MLAALIAAPAASSAQDGLDVTGFETFRAPAAPAVPHSNTIQVPSAGRPLTIAAVDDIPRQLMAASDRAKCKLTNGLLARHPVLIFRPADGYRVMALVPCQRVRFHTQAFQFELSVDTEPTPMTFPVVALNGGISASNRPGLMTWDPETTTLIATRSSDVCPALETRHTYRQGGGEMNGFVLIKIEHRALRCGAPDAEWQTLWQAPYWKLQP
jgi:hypothetical protein